MYKIFKICVLFLNRKYIDFSSIFKIFKYMLFIIIMNYPQVIHIMWILLCKLNYPHIIKLWICGFQYIVFKMVLIQLYIEHRKIL